MIYHLPTELSGKPTIRPGSGRKMMRKEHDKSPQDSTSKSVKGPYSVSDETVHSLSHVRHFATPRTAAHQASLSFSSSQSLLTLMFTESMMPSNHLILCHPYKWFLCWALNKQSNHLSGWPKTGPVYVCCSGMNIDCVHFTLKSIQI